MDDRHQARVAKADDLDYYLPVAPQLIRPWKSGRFAVFLLRGGEFVLYTNEGESYSATHRKKLADMGVNRVYIPMAHKADYELYLRENLDGILLDESIPMDIRTGAWFRASVSLAQDIFEEKLPKPLSKHRFEGIQKLLKDSISFFNENGALRDVVRLVSRGYKSYHHAIGTMVLTAFVLMQGDKNASNKTDKELIKRCCIGALLHDIGKSELPADILAKDPEALNAADAELYRSHPNLGAGLCINLPLAVESYHCITFHHEQADGLGFPSGLRGDSIPPHVRALSVCNAYDALTRVTPWRVALAPFDALKRLERQKQAFDPEMIRRLVVVLSSADLI